MKYLVLGPAALGIFALTGFLKAIEHRLDDLEEISGASSGAVLGFLYLTQGRSVSKAFDVTLETPYKELAKYNLNSFLTDYGFISHTDILKYMLDISPDTFQELYEKTKIKFHVAAFCAETGKTEYFSVDSHPNLRVAEAMCMTISVPFIFSTYRLNGMHYMDGGTIESLPGNPFLKYPPEDVVCIKMTRQMGTGADKKIENLFDYIGRFMGNAISYSTYTYENLKNIYEIPLDDVDIFDFPGVTYDTKVRLFIRGYQRALSHSGLAK
jgi:predicted acylesterase/phospholipase RssA